MEAQLLADALDALLEASEPGHSAGTWQAISAAGYLDALCPESRGGAGLGFDAIVPMLMVCGRRLLGLPLGQTIIARALLCEAGAELPDGRIALAGPAGVVPEEHSADWVLDTRDGSHALMPLATMRGPEDSPVALRIPATQDVCATQALVYAAHIAGAMERLLELTLSHAGERQQFGRALAGFQAVQQQTSVLAEHLAVTRSAVLLAGAGSAPWPDPLRCAVAKAVASAAVTPACAIAHAVHGAIGITAAHPLSSITRSLRAWRLAGGPESTWQRRIGEALLGDRAERMPDFVFSRLSAP